MKSKKRQAKAAGELKAGRQSKLHVTSGANGVAGG